MRSKDTVFIQAEGGSLSVSPPFSSNGVIPPQPVELETDDQLFILSPVDAELLARTIAPQLFEQTVPNPDPLQDIYDDLKETHDSYRRDRNAAQAGDWTATQVRDTLTDLLDRVRRTLQQLQELLPSE